MMSHRMARLPISTIDSGFTVASSYIRVPSSPVMMMTLIYRPINFHIAPLPLLPHQKPLVLTNAFAICLGSTYFHIRSEVYHKANDRAAFF